MPDEIWHADTTLFRPLDNTKVWIYFIVDNFSRFILGWKASLECSARIHFELLKEVFEKYVDTDKKPFPKIKYMVDDGSENKAEVDNFILSKDEYLQKIIAQIDVHFSNSLVEAINKLMKYYYLFRKDLINFLAVINHLEFAVYDHNYVKPLAVLKGLTPFESHSGRSPDFEKYNLDTINARQRRVEIHRKSVCKNHFEYIL